MKTSSLLAFPILPLLVLLLLLPGAARADAVWLKNTHFSACVAMAVDGGGAGPCDAGHATAFTPVTDESGTRLQTGALCLGSDGHKVVLGACAEATQAAGQAFKLLDVDGGILVQNLASERCLALKGGRLVWDYCDAAHYPSTLFTQAATGATTAPAKAAAPTPVAMAEPEARTPTPVAAADHPAALATAEASTPAAAPPMLLARPGRSTPVLAAGFRLGVFSGGFNPAQAQAYAAWLGRPKMDYQVDFSSETGYTGGNPLAGSVGWALSKWGSYPPNMMVSISLSTGQDTSLANVAAGQWDQAYKDTARNVAAKFPNAIVRIGWEFNGGWYPWAAKDREQDYIRAFRRVAQIFLAASNTFTIDWCTAIGRQQFDPSTAYPGDDVVDVISTDAYLNVKDAPVREPFARWKWFVAQPNGLDWFRRFAAQHHKPMGIPEWAINADDPMFIQGMHDFITGNHLAYASYWDSDSRFKGRMSPRDGAAPQYPQASAKFRELFGTTP